MAASKLTTFAVRPVRFAEWLFGPLAPSVDLVLLLFAAGWGVLSVVHPDGFASGAWAGLAWLPNGVWLSFRLLVSALCLVGLIYPYCRSARVTAAFLSAWHWLFVAISIGRIEITPSVLAYLVLGVWSLFAGIYFGGLSREG